jgi:hypothetical protein
VLPKRNRQKKQKLTIVTICWMSIWAGSGAQVVEHLPSNYETLSSNPSTTKTTTTKSHEIRVKHMS